MTHMTDKQEVTEQQIRAVFDSLIEPQLKWSINSLNLLKQVRITDNKVALRINLLTHDHEAIRAFSEEAKSKVRQLGATAVTVDIDHVHVATEGIAGVRSIILVGSGKGGVGKSNVAVNLAAALSRSGQRVGLMDADIYGPSIPTMLGVTQKPQVLPDDYLMPIEAYGMKTMSVGYLIDPKQALDWRGNLASGTILQFFQKTFWGELDTLIVDLPPGTGDIPLTIAHKIKGNGIVMVTTPQELACGDVRRAITLYQDRKIPLLGLVENMSYLVCEKCSHINTPFPSSEQGLSDIDLLLQIPICRAMAEAADRGHPFVLQSPPHDLQGLFLELAQKVTIKLNPDSPTLKHKEVACLSGS
ncbi:P-loop NTPase [Planctomycetota bacterium]